MTQMSALGQSQQWRGWRPALTPEHPDPQSIHRKIAKHRGQGLPNPPGVLACGPLILGDDW